MKKIFYLIAILVFPLAFMACEEDAGFDPLEQQEREELIITEYLANNNIADYQKTESGIFYHVLVPGSGIAVPPADTIVSVHYTGTVLYGNRFDSSRFDDEPFEFQVGTGLIVEEYDSLNNPVFASGGVIAGWVEAVSLMEVGEETRFYIPSQLAYGTRGSGIIPGNTVIYFDIEVLELK